MNRKELLAYAAGFIDGDGSLFITAAKQGRGNGLYFRPSVTAVGINAKPLQRIAGLFGGSVVEAGEVLRCGLHYGAAKNAASELSPYLLLKKKQAETIQLFQKHVDAYKKPGHFRLDQKTLDERMEFVETIKSLNRRHEIGPNFRPHAAKRIAAAYMAGILEAEGYFSISKSGGHPVPTITLAMTDPQIVGWMKTEFGGWSGELNNITAAGRRIYIWRIHRDGARHVAKLIRPYLTFKLDQAEILIRYQNNVDLWKKRLGGVNQFNLPDRVRRQRETMAATLKSLHKRAGATTKSGQPLSEVSDSLVCSDGKAAELGRNDQALATTA